MKLLIVDHKGFMPTDHLVLQVFDTQMVIQMSVKEGLTKTSRSVLTRDSELRVEHLS